MRDAKLSAVVLVLASAMAAAQPLPRLAVSGLSVQGGVDPKVAELLTGLLVADFAAAKKWNVTSSAELSALMGVDRQKQLSGCDDDACRIELAQALGAEWVVHGSVGALGSLRVITVTLFDSKKGVVDRRETIEVADDSALADGIHQLAARLTGVAAPKAPGIHKGWLVTGAGAVLALGGLAFGLVALDHYNQYKMTPTNTGLHASAQTFGYVADGCYGAAIIAGLIGAAMLIFFDD